MAKKKVVTKKTSKAVAVVAENAMLPEQALNSSALASMANYDVSNFDDVELDITENKELFKNDIVIPKIWLIQSMSDLRKEKKADEGDYADSRSGEILLAVDDEKEFLPFIVLKTFKRWQTFKVINAGGKVKKEFLSSEIMVLGKNENLPYQDTIEGDEIVRRQVISAYVLLGSDAQKGIVKPYIIDFASTSKGAGRDLVSDIKVLNAKRFPSFVGWFKLSKFEDSNDEGEFFVKKVSFGGLLPETMLPFLKDAYTEITSMIENNTIEIDDSDLHSSAQKAAHAETNVAGKVSAAGDDV